MRILLDTHAVIWLVEDNPKLGRARQLLADPATRRFVSTVSIWEIAIKTGNGKLRADPNEVLHALQASGFGLVDITAEHATALFALPRFADHRDPFDRMLVAQAQAEGLTLLTADARLRRYPVATLACG